MSRLPLNTLPTFRVVAQLQNLRAAAERLHLTHSAVSHQLRALEQQLGHALFERRGRRLVLNSAGEALLASTERALAELERGVAAAAQAACLDAQILRLTVLPSLPSAGCCRACSAGASAIRAWPWRSAPRPSWRTWGARAFTPPSARAAALAGPGGRGADRHLHALIAVGSPAAARRLGLQGRRPREPEANERCFGEEPLLGHSEPWERWFAAFGVQRRITPVAVFNDVGLMLQAAEQDLGIALAREILAADALRSGRLRRLSRLSIRYEQTQPYHLVYPPALRDWPPLLALKQFVLDELAASAKGKGPTG